MESKRKREPKTSQAQYEEYLNEMETNKVFRTGTINPNLPPDYVDRVWKDLSKRLNSCDSGPVLEWDVWKTRFTNWKNSTRAKYRSYVVDVKKTGGGRAPERKIGLLEERGLSVWGRVAVSGSSKVPVSGGLQLLASCPEDSDEDPRVTGLENIAIVDDGIIVMGPEVMGTSNETAISSALPTKDESYQDENILPSTSTPLRKKIKPNKRFQPSLPSAKMTQPRTIKVIGEELLHIYKENSSKEEARVSLEEKRIQLEYTKLRFEVEKYKYEHPSFKFDME